MNICQMNIRGIFLKIQKKYIGQHTRFWYLSHMGKISKILTLEIQILKLAG